MILKDSFNCGGRSVDWAKKYIWPRKLRGNRRACTHRSYICTMIEAEANNYCYSCSWSMESVLSCWRFYECSNTMPSGCSSPNIPSWEHCSIPGKEEERLNPTNVMHKMPSLTQEHWDPSQVSPELCKPISAGGYRLEPWSHKGPATQIQLIVQG